MDKNESIALSDNQSAFKQADQLHVPCKLPHPKHVHVEMIGGLIYMYTLVILQECN